MEKTQVYACEFNKNNGIYVLSYGGGEAIGELIATEASKNPYGTIHGGLISALVDNVGCFAATDCVDYFVTQTCNTIFLKPAFGSLRAEAHRLHIGKKSAAVKVDVFDESGALIAYSTMTFSRVSLEGVRLIDDVRKVKHD